MEVGKRGGSIAEMAIECGVSRSTFYEFIENNADFSDTVSHARDLALVWWERTGRNAAEGKIVNFSANAFTFQMRNRFADYRDTQRVESTGNVHVTGLPTPTINQITRTIIDPSKLEIGQLEQLAEILESQSQVKSPLTIDHRHEPENDEDD